MTMLSRFISSKIIEPCKRINENTVFFCLIITAILMVTMMPIANAAESVGKFQVENCYEDYEDVNFCDAKALKEYRKAMKNAKVNFNNKYVLHFFKPSKTGFQEVVAIDPASHKVYLTNIEIRPHSTPDFSKYSDKFCFDGDIHAYRNATDNDTFCYQLEEDEYSEFGKGFTRTYD